MIKHFLVNWLVESLKNSSSFNDLIADRIRQVYKNETLKIHRVWGDENRILMGRNVHINNALINTTCGDVEIGDDTFFGHSVSLLTGTHDIHSKGLARQTAIPLSGRDIKIGRGVWIASHAIILGPCEIGDNAVIGAGSVVTGEIEANAFYAGTPAKMIKKLMES